VAVIVEIEAREAGVVARVSVDLGERLLDACDEAEVPLPSACRSADCGVCLVDVARGEDALEPAGANELALLGRLASPATHRLACQLRIGARDGIVHLVLLGRDR